MSFDIMTITNSHGDSRDYPWPAGALMLANAGFVDVHVEEFCAEFPHTTEVNVSFTQHGFPTCEG